MNRKQLLETMNDSLYSDNVELL